MTSNKRRIVETNRFKRDIKTIKKRGYNLLNLGKVITSLEVGEQLPSKYKDHALVGDYVGCRECHISADWLLVYQLEQDNLILLLMRTGSHSDLF